MKADIYLSQLICSRICHDLVGAAGAINAGIELLSEDQSDIGAPLELMSTSAEQVTRRLSFFRVAFGFAGGPDSPFGGTEIQKLAEAFFADKKLALVWDSLQLEGCGPTQKSAGGKLLLLMLMITSDCLVRGGDAQIHVGTIDDGMGIAIQASGIGARYPEDIQAALNTAVLDDQITSRNVHAYFARQLADSVGGAIEIDVGEGIVQIACMVPN